MVVVCPQLGTSLIKLTHFSPVHVQYCANIHSPRRLAMKAYWRHDCVQLSPQVTTLHTTAELVLGKTLVRNTSWIHVYSDSFYSKFVCTICVYMYMM